MFVLMRAITFHTSKRTDFDTDNLDTYIMSVFMSCARSVQYRHIQARNHVLDHSDHPPAARPGTRSAGHADSIDEGYACPERRTGR